MTLRERFDSLERKLDQILRLLERPPGQLETSLGSLERETRERIQALRGRAQGLAEPPAPPRPPDSMLINYQRPTHSSLGTIAICDSLAALETQLPANLFAEVAKAVSRPQPAAGYRELPLEGA